MDAQCMLAFMPFRWLFLLDLLDAAEARAFLRDELLAPLLLLSCREFRDAQPPCTARAFRWPAWCWEASGAALPVPRWQADERRMLEAIAARARPEALAPALPASAEEADDTATPQEEAADEAAGEEEAEAAAARAREEREEEELRIRRELQQTLKRKRQEKEAKTKRKKRRVDLI